MQCLPIVSHDRGHQPTNAAYAARTDFAIDCINGNYVVVVDGLTAERVCNIPRYQTQCNGSEVEEKDQELEEIVKDFLRAGVRKCPW